jgi:hypothetical protein
MFRIYENKPKMNFIMNKYLIDSQNEYVKKQISLYKKDKDNNKFIYLEKYLPSQKDKNNIELINIKAQNPYFFGSFILFTIISSYFFSIYNKSKK